VTASQHVHIKKTQVGGTTITWSSTPGQTYQIAYKDNLMDTTWAALSSNITATDTTTSWTDTSLSAPSNRFYIINILN
jgi:hypothetical protein